MMMLLNSGTGSPGRFHSRGGNAFILQSSCYIESHRETKTGRGYIQDDAMIRNPIDIATRVTPRLSALIESRVNDLDASEPLSASTSTDWLR